ncbi:MAG: CRISPR-associated helicase Cas3' [Anaerolineae bacterium]|nr:CRISPR-associated helicase Cas3' [Anaerolineae bacterium]MDW8170926.1 CRISPR-associated helicase Cas3' [Anaerolineae bacterium]
MNTRRLFQQMALDAFADGHNLIIQAPAGAGKTRAAIEPILKGWSKESYDSLPQKILYAAPLRALVNDIARAQSQNASQKSWRPYWHPRIQTGEQPDDPRLESQFIVTTVDQVLASALTLPYGLPRRQDNLNLGAVLGSYLVFDEFHLYPQQEMMLTVLALLKLFEGVCRFTLMSATFSQVFVRQLADYLGAKTIMDEPGTPIDQGIFRDVSNIQTQCRTWQAHDAPLSAEAILDLRGRRTLVVCNTVARAQALYHAVRQQQPRLNVRLLHAQFYRSDRQVIEAFLSGFEQQDDALLIATQVVEVGLDISSDVLLTECATASSLIQRAGRCARREDQSGRVHVFLPRDEAGQPDFTPYDQDGDDVRAICERTWEALNDPRLQGQVVRTHDEQWLIEQAHGPSDALFMRDLHIQVEQRMNDLIRNWANRDDSVLGLIRKQGTVPLYVCAAPNDDPIMSRTPQQCESFGFRRARLARFFNEVQEQGVDLPFVLCGCDGQAMAQDEDVEDERGATYYRWQPIRSSSDIYRGGYLWFVVHPQAVQYDERGLILAPSQVGQAAKPSPQMSQRTTASYSYQSDTYVEHIGGLYRAYTNYRQARYADELSRVPALYEFAYPMRRLCQRLGKSYDEAERLMRLIIALHDVGKLNKPWQAWAQAWQAHYVAAERLPRVTDPTVPLAHTDYDPRSDKPLRDQFKHAARGPHAVESAEACYKLLLSVSQDKDLVRAALVAIMHHHAPDADSCGSFQAIDRAADYVDEALRVCGFSEAERCTLPSIQASFSRSSIVGKWARDIQPMRGNYAAVLFYYVFVRTLRLCDQRSSNFLESEG